MKTLLLFLFVASAALAQTPATPAPNAPTAKINGKVIRVMPGWVLIDGIVQTPGEEDFDGRMLLRGHPQQATLATDEDLSGIPAVRLPKPFKIDGQVFRAYEYRAPVAQTAVPPEGKKPLGSSLDKKPR